MAIAVWCNETTFFLIFLTPLQFGVYALTAYSLYLLKKHFDDQFFVKRHRWLTLWTVIFVGIFVPLPRSVQESLLLLNRTNEDRIEKIFDDRGDGGKDDLRSGDWSMEHKIFTYCDMVHFALWVGTMTLMCIKQWLYFWDIHYRNAVFDKEWQALLDPQHSEKKWPWYLNRMFGDVKKILLVDLPTTVCICFGLCVLVYLNLYQFAFITFLASLAFTMSALIFLWWKIPKIYDPFFIRGELLLNTMALASAFTGLAVLTILRNEREDLNWQISWSALYLSTLCSYVILYNTVVYVVHGMKETRKEDNNIGDKTKKEKRFCFCFIVRHREEEIEIEIENTNATNGCKNRTSRQIVKSIELTNGKSVDYCREESMYHDPVLEKETRLWQSVVSTQSAKHGYLSFMRWVTKEFANENLLFITEYLMIRKIAQETYIPIHIVCFVVLLFSSYHTLTRPIVQFETVISCLNCFFFVLFLFCLFSNIN